MADGDYVRLAPACHCGSPVDRRPSLGRPTKFCADHRKTQRCAPAEKRVCAWALCGKEFACSAASHQRYCGRKCKDSACNEAAKRCSDRVCETCSQEYRASARDRKRWCSDACRAKALRGLFSCLHCKVEFTPKKKRAGEGEKYCTQQCARAVRSAAKQAKTIGAVCAYYAKACATCGRAGGGRRDWTYCAACDADRARRVAREAAREAGRVLHRAAGRVVECEDCRTQFCPLYGHSLMRLCPSCASDRSAAQNRASRKDHNHRRRARSRGASADRIDPLGRLRPRRLALPAMQAQDAEGKARDLR